ncbi:MULTISPECIES: GntR family transcriptional regulator [Rhizobium/Agrobacterium group]|uniref:GntR family transcriptional regulator n=2 Tax=Neorhizobium TaxID=1525371 RepID=A0ABV0M696_9HYPH|nr:MULTISPECIES: GntR family transcriptional regulator [Rhizobium/Agrobacterium group]MCC2613944.1 GntR family transcriptional regulator [Neorhizobium petrolearium]WGI71467.1 GntR family transcriptional regulator [Neorhizobium petrolearium]
MDETAEKSGSWEAVYKDLQRKIISGACRPRERLIEDEIMVRTGATRHGVRRAFDELEKVGLVIRQPNKGVQVRDYSIREVEELYEIRECLETQAARHFSRPAEPQFITFLTDIAEKHREASRAMRFSEVFTLNNTFHETLYEHAGNKRLAEAIQHYTFSTHPIRTRAFPNEEMREVAIEEHFAMIEAIRQGDGNHLADIIRRHIGRPKDFYLQATNIEASFEEDLGAASKDTAL